MIRYVGVRIMLLVCTVCLIACNNRSSKSLSSNLKDKEIGSWWESNKQLEFPFESISYKTRLGIDSKQLKIQVSMQSHLIKDSILWASISKLGFETHRMILSRDSIKILDRLANQCLMGSTQAWLAEQQVYLTFQDLQALWIGMTPTTPSTTPLFEVKENRLQVDYPDSTQFGYHLRFLLSGDLEYMLIKDPQDQEFSVLQSVFSPYEDNIIPMERTYQMQGEEDYVLDMTIREVKINQPKQVSFRIPEKYEVISL